MDFSEINRVTKEFLQNDPSFKRWLDWAFNPLSTPMNSMLTNPYDEELREWQRRER